jgi:hypothetical protein
MPVFHQPRPEWFSHTNSYGRQKFGETVAAMTRLHTAQARARRRWPFSLFLFCAIGIHFALVPQAKSNFVDNYALNNWLLTNTNADGSAITPDDGVTVIVTGGNNGSGLPGTTTLTIAAAGAGQVQFDWSYSSMDAATFDNTGYVVDNTFFQLADSGGQSGNISFAIVSAETFGFRVGTADNTGEPGILTVTDFSAPSGIASVPEPGSVLMLLTAIVLIRVQIRRGRANCDRLRHT